MRKKTERAGLLLLLIAACLPGMAGCAKQSAAQDLNQPSVKIGLEYGTIMQENRELCYPEAESVYVADISDGILQLKAGQIDALLEDTAELEKAAEADPALKLSDEVLPITGSVIVGVSAESEIPDALDMVNEFLQEMEENGTLAEMTQRWEVEGDYTMPDIPKAEDPTGTMVIGTTGLAMPYTFYSNDELCGFDIELAERFAYWAGMDYTFAIYDWDGIYAAINTGAVDFGFSDLYYQAGTEEAVMPSQAYRTATDSLAVYSGGGASFAKLKQQLYNNFIEEGRWKLLAHGLQVTVILTLLTAVFGCALGFVIAIGKRSRYRMLRGFLNGLTKIIGSVPLLVLLMVFYYIIFKDMSSLVVAVAAFSVNFGASISNAFVQCIGEVSRGQWEAAQTLGFTRMQTFWRIVMPQAMKQFLPEYLSGVISMMLATSVVGYISLIDINFAAQMIRANTYNAIYTLLAAVLLYLLLALLMNLLLKLVKKRIAAGADPLKGLCLDGKTDISVLGQFRKKKDPDETVIEVRGLSMIYPGAVPLKNLDCTVKRGEVIAIIGPSGTGKSTLMRCINRLEEPTGGSIKVFGEEVSRGKPDRLRYVLMRMSMVFQNFCLFEHLTVIENVMLGPIVIRKKSRQEAYDIAIGLLRAMGLGDKSLRCPEELSGGQRQRVAIARALAMDPEILFFDEPTSALDPNTVGEVVYVIRKLAEMGMTMMIVTHNMQVAESLGSRVFYMDQGVVYEEGPADVVLREPVTDRCRVFIRQLKTLRLEVAKGKTDFPGMVGLIDGFCAKYDASKSARFKLYQITEELMVGVISELGYESSVCSVMYDPDTERCRAEITYEGEPYNCLENDIEEYEMNIRLVLHNVIEKEYDYEDGCNRIVLKFSGST